MALFSYPVCTWLCQYVNMGVRKWLEKSAEKQKYKLRKTLNPLGRKAFLGASFSATKHTSPRTSYRSRRLFYKIHLSLILSRLLSKSQPLTLGCDLVLGADLKPVRLFWQRNTRRSKVRFAPTSFYACGKKDVIRSLPCSSPPNRTRLPAGGHAASPRRAGPSCFPLDILRLMK